MRSPFSFDTNYRNQATAHILADFEEMVEEAKKIYQKGKIIGEHPQEERNIILMSVYSEVFLLAERIAEIEAMGKREIKDQQPSALLVKNILDLGQNAMDLQQKIKTRWNEQDGYGRYADKSIENILYSELRDFAYSMTDLALLGTELENRFFKDGKLLEKRSRKINPISHWIIEHITQLIVTLIAAVVLAYFGLN